MRQVCITIVFLVVTPNLLAQQTLNNDSVVKLIEAGFPEDVIVKDVNRSPVSSDTSVDGLIELKTTGLTNTEISAIVAKGSGPTPTPSAQMAPVGEVSSFGRVPGPVSAQAPSKPRVLLRAQSHSSGWHESRDQSMEMAKDFQEAGPEVQISVNAHLANYTVELNHIEQGLLRENQMQVANQEGDLVSRNNKSGSIKGRGKKACAVIVADWAKK